MTKPRIPVAALVLLAPCLFVYLTLFVIPQAGLLGSSTADNYGKVFTDSYYWYVMGRTLLTGVGVTAITLVFGVPLAYWLARMESRWAGFLVMITTFPLLISAVVRSFGWMVLFFRNGLVSNMLVGLGFSDAPVQLMYTLPGVIIALAQVLLPLMVLTLYGVFRSIDPQLELASLTLGARPAATFFLVTLPLARGGLLAGSLLVFALSISAFATPSLVGGARAHVMALAIYEQAIELLNWPFAATLATILLAVVLAIAILYASLLERGQEKPA